VRSRLFYAPLKASSDASRFLFQVVVQKFVLLKADALSDVLFDALSDADGDARQTARWTARQTFMSYLYACGFIRKL